MLDLFIAAVLLWAAFCGWRSGFVKEIISSIGFLGGLLIAAICYKQFGEYLAVNGTESNMLTSLIAFLLLWIVVPIVLGFAANIMTKALKEMELGMPNSILGALVSVVKYLILMSCVLNVMGALHIMNEEKTESSKLYTPVTSVLGFIFSPNECEEGESNGEEDFDQHTDTGKSDTIWVNMTQPKK